MMKSTMTSVPNATSEKCFTNIPGCEDECVGNVEACGFTGDDNEHEFNEADIAECVQGTSAGEEIVLKVKISY